MADQRQRGMCDVDMVLNLRARDGGVNRQRTEVGIQCGATQCTRDPLDASAAAWFSFTMTDPAPDAAPDTVVKTAPDDASGESPALPPILARTLRQFRMLGREDKMQALLGWSRKLEPLPERLAALDRSAFTVPECQTRVDIFPEVQADGTLHFHADINARQSPTIAAVLALVFAAVNDQPPSITLSLPPDLVRQLMQDIGLGARETGLNAMIHRLKRHAADAQANPPLDHLRIIS